MAILTNPDKASGHIRPRYASMLVLRLLLLVAGPALFFCALEGALRVAGFGKPAEFFIPDEQAGFYRTNPSFCAPFIPASFGIQPLNFRIRAHKEPNTVRVFVLGESAAQGMPEPDFGFATQLRAQLRARFPGRAFEVFNLGITAINSHVVYRIVRQVVEFEPDLFVIYMGNNEVVGPYGPGCAYLPTSPPLRVIRAGVWVRSTRTGQLLARLLARLARSGPRAQDWKGMETFSQDSVRGDDPRLEAVYRNFSSNLQDIVEIAGRAGIKTVLATVVANLKDSAPFISLHKGGELPAAQEKSSKEASDAGAIAAELGDAPSAVVAYNEALRIDPEFAETHFQLGRLEESLGQPEPARRYYFGALHWDALRFRPDTRVNEIIRRVAKGAGDSVLLVDAASAMGADPDSTAPLAGRDILFDHVHFNWAGNFRIARLLADGCARSLFGPDAAHADWMDAGQCAAAVGYTPDAELKMLQVVVKLTLRPPFTSQSTFSVDQARLKKEVERANALLGMPGARAAYLGAVERALILDPDNASLAMRLATMEADAGNLERALSLFDRARALQPPSAEMSGRKARVLVRMGRFDEAEALLLGSLGMDEDYYSAGGELVELWAATRQFERGRQFFARELARAPANRYLRLEFANLLVLGGDLGAAEREARRIWDEDPGSRTAAAALELLVRLFERQRRTAEAEAFTLEARAHQADDYFNNQRLAQIYTQRGDPAKVVESLQALAASGPFDAAQHLDLAHRLADLNRGREMVDELARAREIAQTEGDEPQEKRIDELIGIYRRRFSSGQAR
jgi:tetratricopeptide (TPR) repeat protein